jgi:hypothetical protein
MRSLIYLHPFIYSVLAVWLFILYLYELLDIIYAPVMGTQTLTYAASLSCFGIAIVDVLFILWDKLPRKG